MYKKILIIAIVVFMAHASYADAIYQTGNRNSKSVIQSSTISSRIQNISKDYSINYDAAIKELEQKIKSYPNDYTLYPSLIDLYINSNQYEKAYKELAFLNGLSDRKELNKATLDNLNKVKLSNVNKSSYVSDKSSYYCTMAILSNILDEKAQAEKYLLAASKNVVNNDIFLDTAEIIFNSSENYSAAVNVLDKMLLQSPNNSNIRKLKAKYLMQTGLKDEAITELSSVIYSNPDDSDSIYKLYRLLSSKNMQEKDILKKIYGSKTGNLEKIYSDLAKISMDNQDISSAQIFAEKLTKKFPDNVDGYIILSDIYRRQGKLEESYKVLQTVRDKADDKESVSKYNVLLAKLSDEPVKEADALMNNGLYEQALSVLEGANQENLYVILSTARAQYFLNNKQKAFELLNKAMSFYPNNANVYYYFAYIFYKEKDVDSARKYLEQVFKLSPEHSYGKTLLNAVNKMDSDKYLNQISGSIEMQNYPEAMRLVNEALSINDKDSVLYYYKGIIYIAQNNYSAATAPLYKALQLDPKNTSAYFYLGVAFDNLSEHSQALSYYQKYLNNLSSDDYGESEKIDYAKTRIQKLKTN